MDYELDLTELSLGPDTRHIFPFFELARELRDAIYDGCLHDRTYAVRNGEPEICVKGVALRHLSLVSHQFTAEYTSRTRDCGTLVISHKTLEVPKPFQIPQHLRWNIFDLELKLWCSDLSMIQEHRLWIESVLSQMQPPRSVSMCMVIDRRRSTHNVLAEVNQGPWATIPNLVELLVYGGGFDGPLATIYQQLHMMRLVGKWSKTSERVEPIRR